MATVTKPFATLSGAASLSVTYDDVTGVVTSIGALFSNSKAHVRLGLFPLTTLVETANTFSSVAGTWTVPVALGLTVNLTRSSHFDPYFVGMGFTLMSVPE